MYKVKSLFLFLTVLVFSTGSLFAQISSATGLADVKVSVKRALAITNVGGSLEFNSVLQGTAASPTKTPENGVKFRVDGHTSGTVSVTYGSAILKNAALDELTFTPVVHSTGIDPTYNGVSTVNSGDLETMGSSGELYLWVGGSIDIVATTNEGDYSGTFSMTVAY